ncbi:hypothetical protein QFZ35_003245 [Arthrobacter ulcerisalmonis]|nr:hypothetical protein [Arthrobacter ulcerisalmonis]
MALVTVARPMTRYKVRCRSLLVGKSATAAAPKREIQQVLCSQFAVASLTLARLPISLSWDAG